MGTQVVTRIATRRMGLFDLHLEEPERVNIVYEKLSEFSEYELTRQDKQSHTKLIEIVLEVGYDVEVTEVLEPAEQNANHVPPRKLKLRVESSIDNGRKPLLIEASDLLIAAGKEGDTLLHLVAYHGNTEALDKILSAFFKPAPSPPLLNVDLRNREGRTPLHFASGKGHARVAKCLLKHGADMHAVDNYGVTPFHFAARSGNTEILKMLKVNVNILAKNSQMTALHYAIRHAHKNAVEWLLSSNASVNVATKDEGNTPLHYAASMKEGIQVIDSLIVKGGADPQKENKDGNWPIGLADKAGEHELAKAMVKAIRKSATIRMGVHKELKKAILTKTQRSNGATLYHFFAAYGTQEDLEWIMELRKSASHPDDVAPALEEQSRQKLSLEPLGDDVVLWAARLANKDALRVLADNKVPLGAGLAQSVIQGSIEFADELMKWKLPGEDLLSDASKWLKKYLCGKESKLDEKLRAKLATLQEGFARHTNQKSNGRHVLFSEMPSIYIALHVEREDIASFIQRYSPGANDAVNAQKGGMEWTALHWATLLGQKKIVSKLCRSDGPFAHLLTANVEDKLGKTALHYAKQMKLRDIENELMQRSDVKAYVDGLYKDRQLLVDATNAVLVGAALIASVTFAGWLQPPLNYTPYYNLPQLPPPSPPDVFQSYAAVQRNAGVRCFWIFNSLSFTMAISTMVAGLVGVAPVPGIFISDSVRHLGRCLVIASAFHAISIMFVLAAFAAAGFAVLPPLFEYQASMMATMIVGGVPCLLLLIWFAGRLWSFRSRWLRSVEAALVGKLGRLRSLCAVADRQASATDQLRPSAEIGKGSRHEAATSATKKKWESLITCLQTSAEELHPKSQSSEDPDHEAAKGMASLEVHTHQEGSADELHPTSESADEGSDHEAAHKEKVPSEFHQGIEKSLEVSLPQERETGGWIFEDDVGGSRISNGEYSDLSDEEPHLQFEAGGRGAGGYWRGRQAIVSRRPVGLRSLHGRRPWEDGLDKPI